MIFSGTSDVRSLRGTSRKVVSAVLSGKSYSGGDVLPAGIASDPGIPAELLVDLLRGRYGYPVDNIDLVGLVIHGVNLSYRHWSGRLNLVKCLFTGSFNVSHAVVQGRICLDGSHVAGFHAIDARIDGSIHLRDGFTAPDGVRGLGLSVTGSLSVRGSTLGAPAEVPSRAALDLFRASIGDLFVNNSDLRGGIYANGSTIRRNIRLQGARIQSRQLAGMTSAADAGDGISLVNVTVGGAIYFWTSEAGPTDLQGTVSLNGARCQTWTVHPTQLEKADISIDNFTYRRILPATGSDVLRLLSGSSIAPSAYGHLAEHFEALGQPALSRITRISLQRRLARSYPLRSREGFTRRTLGILVGYGYRPALALLWLSVAVTMSGLLIMLHPGLFQPAKGSAAKAPTSMSWVESIALAVDNVVPFISTGSKEQWTLTTTNLDDWPWFTALLLLKIAGWAFAILGAASVTGAIRSK
ncbi:hypothetical protein [Winogradskya humida]|uniref:Oxidoreductase n=1 Tax=Winogradskya humida TaxID=113566 RepID=A0ABQ3ZZR1_9ACTN|nr:hypothetical protein [Actinoplanes humidus]GIE24086.1 oxidoreductase [Actinoplanes humidus]